MKKFIGIYDYSASGRKYDTLNKCKTVSNGDFAVYYDDDNVSIIADNPSFLCAAKGFFYSTKIDEKNVNSSNGNYISALYDAKNEKLTLARSIFGAVPLYFFDDGKSFFFSSHCDALKEFAGSEINSSAFDGYFTHKAVMAQETIYKNIYALKAGNMLVKTKKLNSSGEVYDKLAFVSSKKTKFSEASKHLKKLVTNSLGEILKQNPKTAVFLSGGIDSNITASLAAKMGVAGVFSAKVNDSDFDESEYSKKAAKYYGLDYNEIPVNSFNYDDLFHIAEAYEQPFADASAYAMYKITSEASKKYKSFLTGDGADELFGGYLRYRAVKAAMLVPRIIKKPLGFFGSFFNSKSGDRSLRRYIHRFASAMSDSVCDINAAWYTCFSDEEKKALFAGTEYETLQMRQLDEYKKYCVSENSINGIYTSDILFQLADCFSIKVYSLCENSA